MKTPETEEPTQAPTEEPAPQPTPAVKEPTKEPVETEEPETPTPDPTPETPTPDPTPEETQEPEATEEPDATPEPTPLPARDLVTPHITRIEHQADTVIIDWDVPPNPVKGGPPTYVISHWPAGWDKAQGIRVHKSGDRPYRQALSLCVTETPQSPVNCVPRNRWNTFSIHEEIVKTGKSGESSITMIVPSATGGNGLPGWNSEARITIWEYQAADNQIFLTWKWTGTDNRLDGWKWVINDVDGIGVESRTVDTSYRSATIGSIMTRGELRRIFVQGVQGDTPLWGSGNIQFRVPDLSWED